MKQSIAIILAAVTMVLAAVSMFAATASAAYGDRACWLRGPDQVKYVTFVGSAENRHLERDPGAVRVFPAPASNEPSSRRSQRLRGCRLRTALYALGRVAIALPAPPLAGECGADRRDADHPTLGEFQPADDAVPPRDPLRDQPALQLTAGTTTTPDYSKGSGRPCPPPTHAHQRAPPVSATTDNPSIRGDRVTKSPQPVTRSPECTACRASSTVGEGMNAHRGSPHFPISTNQRNFSATGQLGDGRLGPSRGLPGVGRRRRRSHRDVVGFTPWWRCCDLLARRGRRDGHRILTARQALDLLPA